MKPEYVKCTWTFSDSDYEQGRIYRVSQKTKVVYPIDEPDTIDEDSHLYANWDNTSRTQFEPSTLIDYVFQQNLNSKVSNSENLDYLIPFLTSNNIT